MYRDMREFLATRTDIDALLIATGDRWHATAADLGHALRQGRLFREALLHDHRRGPGGRGHREALRPHLSDRHPAAQRGQLHLRQRIAPHRPTGPRPHRPRPHRPVGRRGDEIRLAARRAGAAQGRGGLGRVARPVPLAALQLRLRPRRLARLLRLPHQLHRRMGRPHLRPVPGGHRRRRHLRRRVRLREQRHRRRHGHRLRQRREDDPVARRRVVARLLWRALRRHRRLGGRGRRLLQAGSLLARPAGRLLEAGQRLHGAHRAPDEPRAQLLRLHQDPAASPWPTRRSCTARCPPSTPPTSACGSNAT